MTVDVNVRKADEAFLDDIDEIIEDTMVQIFVLCASNEVELERVQKDVTTHNTLFYYAPIEFLDRVDKKCLGFLVKTPNDVLLAKDKVLYVQESSLDEAMLEALIKSQSKGIILNATKPYPSLENFFISISGANIEIFDTDVLAKLPMDKIVLESSYPEFDFEEIFLLSKKISDKNFRPDQSIIAQATKNSLALFGFHKWA